MAYVYTGLSGYPPIVQALKKKQADAQRMAKLRAAIKAANETKSLEPAPERIQSAIDAGVAVQVPIQLAPNVVTVNPPETLTAGDTSNGSPVEPSSAIVSSEGSKPFFEFTEPIVEVSMVPSAVMADTTGDVIPSIPQETNPLLKWGMIAVGVFIFISSYKNTKTPKRRRRRRKG